MRISPVYLIFGLVTVSWAVPLPGDGGSESEAPKAVQSGKTQDNVRWVDQPIHLRIVSDFRNNARKLILDVVEKHFKREFTFSSIKGKEIKASTATFLVNCKECKGGTWGEYDVNAEGTVHHIYIEDWGYDATFDAADVEKIGKE